MKEKEIKQLIENNKKKLPLSYNNVIFRNNLKSMCTENFNQSKKEVEKESISIQFYKPITRF